VLQPGGNAARRARSRSGEPYAAQGPDPQRVRAIIRGGAAFYVERYGAKIDRSRSERDAILVDDRWQPPWGGPGRPERTPAGHPRRWQSLHRAAGQRCGRRALRADALGQPRLRPWTNYFHLARAENPTIKALDVGYFTPDSPHYASYLNAVAAGANFAIVNRFAMFEQIALAFEEVFARPLSLMYEISHNLVQRELSPEFGWVHVH
jgi:tRNA-splicing ligase RtcB (3'-phosphate/5'-hydroxy nucleic acid ligase)